MCSAVKEFFCIWQSAASSLDIFMDNQYIVTQDTDSVSGRVPSCCSIRYLVAATSAVESAHRLVVQ